MADSNYHVSKCIIFIRMFALSWRCLAGGIGSPSHMYTVIHRGFAFTLNKLHAQAAPLSWHSVGSLTVKNASVGILYRVPNIKARKRQQVCLITRHQHLKSSTISRITHENLE